MIRVEGLSPAVSLKKGRFQSFQECNIVDINIGIMNKSTGFDVTGCVNMEITPAAGNAPVYILTVIQKSM